MKKPISTCLWFASEAEEAAAFYTSMFPGSKVLSTTPGPEGKAVSVSFTMNGQEFLAINGRRDGGFTEATSFVIHCENQAEIDSYWAQLTGGGGAESMCGWCTDKFGVSWQVVPEGLGRLLSSPKAMQAMFKMRKLDIAALAAAA